MSWYKSDITELDLLLSWLSGDDVALTKVAYVMRSNWGGNKRRTATPEQEKLVMNLLHKGLGPFEVSKRTGFTFPQIRGIVNRDFLRRGKTPPQKPNPPGVRAGLKGIANDPLFIDKVKKLRSKIDPRTGKPYTKMEISRILGTSYQTIDRIISSRFPSNSNEIGNYVSHAFWNRYSTGMVDALKSMRADKRMDFVNSFIDSLFSDPQTRQQAKELVYHKLKLRNVMTLQPDTDPRTQLFDRDYEAGKIPDMRNSTTIQEAVKPNVPSPQAPGAWKNKKHQDILNQMVEQYKIRGKGSFRQISDGYRPLGISPVDFQRELQNRNLLPPVPLSRGKTVSLQPSLAKSMNWYRKIANLPSTLKSVDKTPGLVNLLNSLGFDGNGKEMPCKCKLTEEQKREWNEQEHEHEPA